MKTDLEEKDLSHPWKSRNNWFPDDQRLRDVGCAIARRPLGGPDIWQLPSGTLLTTQEALAWLDAALKMYQR
jgi:hypothetical protein